MMKEQNKQQKSEGKSDQSDGESPTSLDKAPAQLPQEHPHAGQKTIQQKWLKWIRKVFSVEASSGWIALFTLALVVTSVMQWCAMGNQLRESKLSSELSERAYLYARPGFLYCVSDNCPLENYTNIGNSGKTYAKDVEQFAGMIVRPPLTPNEIANLGPGNRQEGITIMSPGIEHAIMQRGGKLTAEGADQSAVMAGTKRIYVFGEIRYTDVFGHPHRLEFCNIYWGTDLTNFPENGGPGYVPTYAKPCEKHNSAS
ncbi:MAG: hypothetical protein HYY65_03820 [Candidatus Tectomicrobia bacterium]|uniref:Uncharacterized protein n=1 Tax=Tectimicrobiota bacterium TaxID=2528274 RepID=A0A932LZG7_UNCTE|nr:hypothetical protein [Candidatus Tectomicrobia bacterium]